MQKIIFILFISLLTSPSFASLRLPSIIDNNMVLQQGKSNNIWGWSEPGSAVTIRFNNKTYSALTNKHGEWKVVIAPCKAGSAGDMQIASGNETRVISNILAGEVWLCSGQSNMEYTLGGFKDFYKDEIETANDDGIRYIVIKNTFDKDELKNAGLKNSWLPVSSSSVLNCSAVGYFFAKKLRGKLKVPVGLIVSSWGGTPAQSWLDTSSLKDFKNYKELYQKSIRSIDFDALNETRNKSDERFHINLIKAAVLFQNMRAAQYDDAAWVDMQLPENWESLGYPDLDGVAAYRIKLTVPAEWAGMPVELHMPGIDDVDSTYLNGTLIGTYNVWNEKRLYKIPANILKAGENVIAIWVYDGGGGGGLQNEPDDFYLQLGTEKISLTGKAKFKVLVPMENIAAGINYASLQNQPAVLFNGMIAPLLNYGIRGVTWYQGEANVSDYKEYRTLFPALINCWRRRFNNKDLPFFFVQLASFNPDDKEPAESEWAGLREAQAVALKLPFTGMAVTVDVGEEKDIHPKRKKEVGDRLAANAFNIVYGYKNEVAAGPLFRSSVMTGTSIKISYSNAGKGLMQKGNELAGFMIASADKYFVKANALIKGNEVIVSNNSISVPVYVRYAWANAPLDANLYNIEGFPAAPFRTDK
ncbi:sialate O-acetylesterase [soil metagenome]